MKQMLAMILGLGAMALSASAETTDQSFQSGNEKYASGDFRSAITDYESAIRTGDWSANLFYNLGNAYDRTEDFGRAILSYERALALEPSHPEAKANLQIARDQSQALTFTPSRFQQILASLSEDSCAIVAAVCFWITLGLLVWRARGGILLLASASLVVAVVSAAAVFFLQQQNNGRAVVTGPTVEARVATADSAKSVLALPPGSEIQILQRRGDWSYAILPNNERGWIPANAAEVVRL